MISSIFYRRILGQERLATIDHHIETSARLLMESDLVVAHGIDYADAEEIILDVFGGYRLGLIIILADTEGRILYANSNAKTIDLKLNNDIARLETWQFIEEEENKIRLFTTRVPGTSLILHFGSLVNAGVHNPDPFYLFTEPLGLLLMLLIAGFSYIITTILLRPLRNLADYLDFATSNMDQFLESPENTPKALRMDTALAPHVHDEFTQMAQSLRRFMEQVKNALHQQTHHSAQLAHEINTPLAVIKAELAQIPTLQTDTATSVHLQQADFQLNQLSEFVRHYLDWSVQYSLALAKPEIHAIALKKYLPTFCERMELLAPGRITATINTEEIVFCNPQDMEHLFMNLVTNALKYSPPEFPVNLRLEGRKLTISDTGPGIPSEVLKRLGQPFNLPMPIPMPNSEPKNLPKAITARGHGLGLAWVDLIAKRYNWTLKFITHPDNPHSDNRQERGTQVLIIF